MNKPEQLIRRWGVLLLACVLPAVSAASRPDTSEPERRSGYTDEKYGFQLVPPADWEHGNLAAYSVPGELRAAWTPNGTTSITVFVQKPGHGVSPGFLAESSVNAISKLGGVVVKQQEVIAIAGREAMSLVGVGPGTGGALTGNGPVSNVQHWIAIPRERDVIVLLLTTPEADFETHTPAFEAMLDTLEIEDIEANRTGLASIENLDFEQGNRGDVPPGWFVPTAGYAAELVGDNVAQGSQCARLFSRSDGEKHPFGNLMRSIDAAPYRAKRVRFRAAVRVNPAREQDRAQMWMRVDRPDGEMGFFDNMGDRPTQNRSWDYYEIVGDVADDAERICIGLILLESGEVWLDDVSFEILGDVEQPVCEAPRPLEGRGLENLIALTRLLGYVRYFHPSDEAAWADWEQVAIVGVQAAEPAETPDELARVLEDIFRPLGPTIHVFPTGETPPVSADVASPPDRSGLKVTAWWHFGCGTGSPNSVYRSERRRYETEPGAHGAADRPDPAKPLMADLGGGVSCMVPLAVYVDADGTIPNVAASDEDGTNKPSEQQPGNDRATRLAAVALCWNVMQHFYPYFDVVDTDWPAALTRALTSAATDADERAFHTTLRHMIAALHDGHGHALHYSDDKAWTLPLLWDWIEGRLVITYVSDGVVDLKPGDVVVTVDGKPAEQALTEVESLISAATPQWRRHRGLQRLAAGRQDEMITLEVKRADDEFQTVTATRTTTEEQLSLPRPPMVDELRPGIFYVDIDRISDAGFKEALPRLEQAKGIIFDFRGYPRNIQPLSWIPHIIKERVRSPQWHTPVVTRPDRQGWQYVRFGEWNIAPQAPYLEARKVFLIDGGAISYAESCLGIIEHYKLGELVGEPTAGTNGNVNRFELPGGYRIIWTGMKVLKQDDSRHHGVGILPTVPVSQTIQGVARGCDEQLDQAVKMLRACDEISVAT